MAALFFSSVPMSVSQHVLMASSQTQPLLNAKDVIPTVRNALQPVLNAHLVGSCQASTFSWTLSIRFVFKFVQMELLKISKTSNATPAMTAVSNVKVRQAIVQNAQQRTLKNITNSRQ
jgi:hypothetical protein